MRWVGFKGCANWGIRNPQFKYFIYERTGTNQKVYYQPPEPKRSDMEELHRLTLQVSHACKLWFLDGKNSENKTVSNPNIGYGSLTVNYANGESREFYQIGMSANKTGFSIYIMGVKDKTYLAQTYGEKIGKASVTGYCIKFKTQKD